MGIFVLNEFKEIGSKRNNKENSGWRERRWS